MKNNSASTFHSRHTFPTLFACALATAVSAHPRHARADAAEPPITPAMKWLGTLPDKTNGERALGQLFADGTATYVPTGSATGYPVLFSRLTDLDWLAAQLWGGKTLRVVSSETLPNGDPIVRLDNKIIKTPTGGLLNIFQAWVRRSTVADLIIGTNARGQKVPSPSGTLAPIPLSFLKEPIAIDDRPSILLNYFEDTTLPVIRRILDEIREIDGVNCKGLFLGRAHARRCTSFDCGEVPSPLVDTVAEPVFETRYEWGFWTYFILNFSPADQACDLGPALKNVTAALHSQGVDVDLSDAPPAN
jgi:hypothetical protein